MRKLLLMASAVLFVAPARAEIAWRPDLTTAHAEAVETGKLLLVHFYKDNCVWCEKAEQGVFQDRAIAAAIESRFVPVKVHGEREPAFAAAFSISRYPTDVIVATDDGKVLAHRVTPQDAGRYIAMLHAPEVTERIGHTAAAAPATAAPATAAPATDTAHAGRNAGGANGVDAAHASAPVATGTLGFPAGAKYNPQVAGPGPEMNGAMMPAGIAAGNFDMPSFSGAAFHGGTPAMPAGFAGLAPPANSEMVEDEQPLQSQRIAAEPIPATEAKTGGKKKLPPEAMEGYCAVTVIEQARWERGNPEFGVIHLGQLYLFTDAAAKKRFQESPERYTPVLNGIDVVKFFDQRVVVQGSREWGYTDPLYGRMFLFADEASMNHFYLHFDRYTTPAVDLMKRAAAEANAAGSLAD